MRRGRTDQGRSEPTPIAHHATLTASFTRRYGHAGRAQPLHDGEGLASEDRELALFDAMVSEWATELGESPASVAAELHRLILAHDRGADDESDGEREEEERRLLAHFDHEAAARQRASMRSWRAHETQMVLQMRAEAELRSLRSRAPPPTRLASSTAEVSRLEAMHKRQAELLRQARQRRRALAALASADRGGEEEEAYEDDEAAKAGEAVAEEAAEDTGGYDPRRGQSLTELLQSKRKLARRQHREKLQASLLAKLEAEHGLMVAQGEGEQNRLRSGGEVEETRRRSKQQRGASGRSSSRDVTRLSQEAVRQDSHARARAALLRARCGRAGAPSSCASRAAVRVAVRV